MSKRRKHRKPRKRPDSTIWQELREAVWMRDGGKCVKCVEEDESDPTVSLEECHIDHIVPLSRGGTNRLDNLRTLCRHHHVLRKDAKHRGLIAKALDDSIIPPDWRKLVWE